MILDPKVVSVSEFHKLLVGAVAPRPIAFASTVDKNGNVNLSPFSFFNCFSANPPILIFSPSRRVRDNTLKHTLENVFEIDEVVINLVSYAIVEQTSLASSEYDKTINEFTKAGLTEERSILVRPPRVKEAPVSFECRVQKIIPLGVEKGAGNLVICEVLLAHLNEMILDDDGTINPHKMDLVARMGGDLYCRASGAAVFELPKPGLKVGIGVDQMPDKIRFSKILSGNNLGRLGGIEKLPNEIQIEDIRFNDEVKTILDYQPADIVADQIELLAKKWIEEGKVFDAWKVLLLNVKK